MKRSGFTLIELLVAVGILLVLAAIIVTTLNYTAEQERITREANSVATFLEGGRSRAIMDRKPVGVKFLLNQDGPKNSAGNPITVSSMMYVEQLDNLNIQYSISTDDRRTITFWTTGPDGVPGNPGDDDGDMVVDEFDEIGFAGSDDVYTGDEFDHWDSFGSFGDFFYILDPALGRRAVERNGMNWQFTSDWPANPSNTVRYWDVEGQAIAPVPVARANQIPRELDRNVVIDLETSRIHDKIPSSWYDTATNSYNQDQMVILFSPRGTVDGPYMIWGLISLLTADVGDIENTTHDATLYDVTTRPNHGRERFITIATKSGGINVSEIDLRDQNNDGILNDPFAYAEGVRD